MMDDKQLTELMRNSFAADEPAFESLRPDVRQTIREVETDMQSVMAEMLDSFPADWRPALEARIVIGTTRGLVRSLLPFFKDVNKALDICEMVRIRKLLDPPGGR